MRGCSCRGTAGFAHVSCLAEQAKLLNEEAEENGLFGTERGKLRWRRWTTCSLCEQGYHGVVYCALGWACWKTYLGRPQGPEADWLRGAAMTLLGNGLSEAERHEEALSVQEARLSTLRRTGASEKYLLIAQGNLACTYDSLGRREEASRIRQEVYSGNLKLYGAEHRETLREASNFAATLLELKRYQECLSLMRKSIPVARRVLGESNGITLAMQLHSAVALYSNDDATPNDFCEAMTTLEETGRTARRVLGDSHSTTGWVEVALRDCQRLLVRAALRAREAPPTTA